MESCKEYLEKQPDGTYALVLRGDLCKDDDIEVPEGMNYAYDAGSFVQFTKQEMGYRDSVLVWQRESEQDEPFLTPECTINDQYAEIEQVRQPRHYFKDVSNLDEIDVYMVLKLFNVTDPCLQHIAKKALCAGQRGHKNLQRDLQDILDTAKRAVEINKNY